MIVVSDEKQQQIAEAEQRIRGRDDSIVFVRRGTYRIIHSRILPDGSTGKVEDLVTLRGWGQKTPQIEDSPHVLPTERKTPGFLGVLIEAVPYTVSRTWSLFREYLKGRI